MQFLLRGGMALNVPGDYCDACPRLFSSVFAPFVMVLSFFMQFVLRSGMAGNVPDGFGAALSGIIRVIAVFSLLCVLDYSFRFLTRLSGCMAFGSARPGVILVVAYFNGGVSEGYCSFLWRSKQKGRGLGSL
ncbi:hypothetical protein HNY73_013879 [Argiope bruennichi]|uniref:Uncharacterized protein n=1 Tax=Argiope bruennichi TaxID=94029 RepID=A0A8T0ERE4_ARGBR|nr:hypothetical protein HNY73_013879 [Argiope bruennichi]